MTQTDVFSLTAGSLLSANDLIVREFEGEEALSELFRFDIRCTSTHDPSTLEPMLLALPATFHMRGPGSSPRLVHGIVSSVRYEGLHGDDRRQYRIRLVPHMWLLRKRKNSRIFQDKSTPEIVRTIFAEHRVPFRLALTERYEPREYCVQYQETDYDFVRRLLADEGICFYFDPPSGLVDELTGGFGSAIAGVVDEGLGAAASIANLATGSAGPLAGASNVAANVMGTAGLETTVVLVDSPRMYPPLPQGSLEGLASGELSSIAGVVTEAADIASGVVEQVAGGVSAAMSGVAAFVPAPVVEFHPAVGMVRDEDCVTEFGTARALKSLSVALGGYSFGTPNHPLRARVDVYTRGHTDLLNEVGGELRSVFRPRSQRFTMRRLVRMAGLAPADAANLAATAAGINAPDELRAGFSIAPSQLEVYEAEPGHDQLGDISAKAAARALQRERRLARRLHGEATCRRFCPGFRFTLEEHPVEDMNREYALVRVIHAGHVPENRWGGGSGARGLPDAREVGASSDSSGAPGGESVERPVYINRFLCIPAKLAYRPETIERSVQVLETATVVGPGNEEVYADEHGRIKVQFHWDRAGQRNERSSCWIRLAQPWAGSGWGFQFLPRVGMEVIIGFLGGNPDEPVVMGCVNNATHRPTYALPGERFSSGIRTRSAPNGQGYNELFFGDATGTEVVRLKAQKDLDIPVGGNFTTHVAGSWTASADSTYSFAAPTRRVEIRESDSVRVGREMHSVIGNANRFVGGTLDESVSQQKTEYLNGRMTTNEADDTSFISGFKTQSIGSEAHPAIYSLHVYGTESHQATKRMSLHSDTSISLTCGSSVLMITPEQVIIRAKEVMVDGTDATVVRGKGAGTKWTKDATTSAKAIFQFAKNAMVELKDGRALVQAPKLEFKNRESEPEAIERERIERPMKPFRWRFLDETGTPYANKNYRVYVDDFRKHGTTSAEGQIDIEIPEDGQLAEIMLWPYEYPEGEIKYYHVRIIPLPPATTAYGAKMRLLNLGYRVGPLDDSRETEAFRAALRSFQANYGLPVTGNLDAATSGKLDEVHPS